MDDIDRLIINETQGGFPVSERPFAELADRFDLSEAELINRMRSLREDGVLSRFGPLFHAERMGGGLTLAAMAVPEDRYEEVTKLINAHDEVAHNYARDHALNMWFVLATETPERIADVIAEIEAETGITVLNMPREEEFFGSSTFEVDSERYGQA